MANKLQKKFANLTQEAYIQVFKNKFDEELAKCHTEEELEAFHSKWNNIINQLSEGWILNPEEI